MDKYPFLFTNLEATLLNITVGRLLEDTAPDFPSRAAVETPEGAFTYMQLNSITDDAAGRMLLLGITRGTHIGIWSKDRPYSLITYLAAERIGAVPVLFNTSLTGSELSVLINKTDVEFLFFDDGYRGVSFPETCSHLKNPAREHLIFIGDGKADGFFKPRRAALLQSRIISLGEKRRPAVGYGRHNLYLRHLRNGKGR
jgi:fatty-acyl-CoA synthase